MKKKSTKGGQTSVTFELPAEAAATAQSVVLCGEFNDWSRESHPMKKRKDGSFSVAVRLDPGRYHYRYFLDEAVWENDWSADDYAPNPWGSEDSIVIVD